ncbi:MAG: peptidoglycan DD-metalloendopeptidase family protein [Actinobacteria bacterium]|nr:peptidoglycan DD-metalloendopeptidase family protein [Actinomycetota bacterium]
MLKKINKNTAIKLVIFLLLLSCMASSIVIVPRHNLYAQTLEEELTQIKKEREEANKKIEEVRKQEQAYYKQVKEVETQLLASLSQLDDLNTKLAEAKSNIDKTTIELVLKEQDLNKIEDELDGKIAILNRRVASIYKNRDGNILEILLKAEDFIEFISRLKLMNLIAQQDAEIIKEIKDKRTSNLTIKKAILDLREKQKDRQTEVAKLVSQAEKKQAEVEGIYNEKSNLLSNTSANKNALIYMQKDLEIREAEITRILESYRYGNAPGDKFMWPVAGFLKSRFGMRRHPLFGKMRMHTGVDLVAPNGALVKAGDGGQIIQAGYDGGYGYSIIVYHGGGFSTVYAHLSRILVAVGQNVSRGEVIGLVGSTGWTTGPHLHFEVRINGAAQDPLGYLQ